MNQPIFTKRSAKGQIVFCQGCCCGRTDRGKPELPVDRLKSVWRDEKLNRTIQLTISGCLGPCDLTNVALIMTPRGNVWLGDMNGQETYEAIIDWARDCHAHEQIVPLPALLDRCVFDRFADQRAIPFPLLSSASAV